MQIGVRRRHGRDPGGHRVVDRQDPAGQRLVPEGGRIRRRAAGLLRTAVSAGGGRLDLLHATERAEQRALGTAHAARVRLQHQGLLAAHPAPHPAQLALQGPAPHRRGRHEERLPQGRRRQDRRRGLAAVPRRAGAAARGRQARHDPVPVPAVVPDRQAEQGVPAPGEGAVRADADGRGVPEQDVAERAEPGRDARLPPRLRRAVRLRRHAAGPRQLGAAGPRRHHGPVRGALPRAQRQVDQPRHLRPVRLPLLRA